MFFEHQDKVHHMGAYFIMAMLTWRFFKDYITNTMKLCIVTLCFCSIYGLSDEWHQSFVPGRYADIMDYAKEKQRIFSGNGVMVINEDDSVVNSMRVENRDLYTFSVIKKTGFHVANQQGENWLMNAELAMMRQSELAVEGLHNVANALAALALGTAAGLNNVAMCNALRRFKGLNHRMQKVGRINGVTWVNDSKATNIGACVAALQGYQNKVILIAGGDAKGADMKGLVAAIEEKAICVVLMGKDADKIESAINGCVPSYRVENIQEAVKQAAKLAKDGGSVLLSPACASFDQYKGYQERGDKFTEAVMELVA